MDKMGIKKKLRALKKQEIRIRYPNGFDENNHDLVWHQFFSTNEKEHNVKYPLNFLLIASKSLLIEIKKNIM